ncbi:MAG: UbiA family prenyltransferase [Actinomycetia bacterium]|nr:UbiA family prenyltransferase [Actinomycetes bacterium]
MSGAVALLRSCHPGPTAAVTVIAALLGVSAGLSGGLLLAVIAAVLVGQLSIGWSNDWLDAGRDAAAGRTDKPAATGLVEPSTLRAAALWSGALSAPISLATGWGGGWHLLLVASGWAYNLGLKGTAWSPVPYAVGFAALPVYVTAVAGVGAPWWVPASGGTLGVAAHFANAAPDVEQDRAFGIRGLPQRIGARSSLVVALALLGCVGGVLLTQIGLNGLSLVLAFALVALPLIVGTTLIVQDRIGRPAFTVVMVAAVLDVALLLAAA